MDRQTDRKLRWTDEQADEETDSINGETNNRDEQTDRQTDRQADKQTVMGNQNRTRFRFFQLPIIESAKNKFDRFFFFDFLKKKIPVIGSI
jgi:hypothetical protein